MTTKVSGIGMDYFFLLGYIIIISTGWQHMRRRRAQSAKRIAFLGLRFFAMLYALCAMRGGINLEDASASAIPVVRLRRTGLA
ncbi:MAG: hypothetical protein WBF55_03960, partial [Syntrophobacteria bacterium]